MTDRRIHIIDDDLAARRSTALLLRAFDFDVTEWALPLAFLAAASADCAGCLIVDMRMPGLTGTELLEQLAARDIHIPTILVTGHASIGDPATSLPDVVALLEKPFPAENLLAAIDEAIRR